MGARPHKMGARPHSERAPKIIGARPHLLGGLVISSFSSLQLRVDFFLDPLAVIQLIRNFSINLSNYHTMYHREQILKSSTLSCNEEKEEITKPPTR